MILKDLKHTLEKALPEMKSLFALHYDTDEQGTVEQIKSGVVFQGGNLWILIFAILVASIGLNVNSTAVIIGAMLISPLMGPIVGAGLSLAINDFPLLKRALKNLAIASLISILTSAIYFFLSPLSEAQSELLARTSPTIYDVMIALFGGAAGMVASSRKVRGNAVAGVAIATALMPPLCTAGYALARLDLNFFLGAIYLYSINSVFICWASFLVVKFLRFKKVTFIEVGLERRVNLYMTIFAIITMVPSIYTAYSTVKVAFFESNANQFIAQTINFEHTKVIDKKLQWDSKHPKIEVSLIGIPLTESQKTQIRSQLSQYRLRNVELIINDAGASVANEMERRFDLKMKTSLLGQLYDQNQLTLKGRDEKIALLESELMRYKEQEQTGAELAIEITKLAPRVQSVSYGSLATFTATKETPATSKSAVILAWKQTPSSKEKLEIEKYLNIRLDNVKPLIFHYRLP